MQPYQERVVSEKKELDEKIQKLKAFLLSTTGPAVEMPREDLELLERQLDAMNQYSLFLFKRIRRFLVKQL